VGTRGRPGWFERDGDPGDVIHAVQYAGFPRALNAISVVTQVLIEEGVDVPPASAPLEGPERLCQLVAAAGQVGGFGGVAGQFNGLVVRSP
jgi:hypothetical protein